MTDIKSKSRSTRESLARGLNQLQWIPNPPATYLQAAEPIAKAMGALHRLENDGDPKTSSAEALESIRGALALLQQVGANDPNLSAALETVASCLGSAFELTKLAEQVQPPTANMTQPVQQAQPAYQAPAQQPQQQAPYQAPAPQAQPAYQAPAQQPQQQAQPAYQAPAPQQQAPYQPPAQQQQAPYQAPAQQQAPYQAPAQQQRAPYQAPAQQQRAPYQAPPQQQPPAQQAPVQQQQQAPYQAPPQQQPPAQQAPVQQQQQAPGAAWDPFASPSAGGNASAGGAQSPAKSVDAYRANTDNLRSVEASLGATGPTNFYKGLSGDDVIEHGGLFVQTYQVPEVGEVLRLHVFLPGGYEFEAVGEVAWTRESRDSMTNDIAPPGFGVKFVKIDQAARQLVYRYVRNREPLFHDDF